MRKLLIAGGDSNTDDNYVSDFHPELKCDWKKWPEILADKLDMDFINLETIRNKGYFLPYRKEYRKISSHIQRN